MKTSNYKIEHSFLKILTGTNLSSRKIPLMVAKSRRSGPIVFLTGCIHGDEVAGMVVIQEIFKKIKKTALLRGTIFALPLVNPLGFEAVSRFTVVSEEDLNRRFPGNKDGSFAERVADKIFSFIKEKNPDILIDIHNDWVKSIPYILIDPRPVFANKKTYAKTNMLAQKTGFLTIEDLNTPEDIAEARTTLSGCAASFRIPAITMELGEPNIVNEKNVFDGVCAIWRILEELGMVASDNGSLNYNPPSEVLGKKLMYSPQPVSSKSGIIRLVAKPGSILKDKQEVARIYNAFGGLEEVLLAKGNGIMLGHSDYSVAFPGLTVASFGLIKDS